MPDGKRRGGFARLAAVVKAERERAKGGHVMFAHGGDTLSPSLMSGIDQGAHIIALTNMPQAGHFRAGQSRVRFRQGGFPQAHGGGEVSGLCRQHAPGRTASRCRASRTATSSASTACGSGSPAPRMTTRRACRTPEDLKFLPTVATMKAQAEALRRDGVDLVVVVMHADRQPGRRAGRDPRRRSDPDRSQPRPVHPVRRPRADGRSRATTRITSPSSICTSRRKQQGNRREVEWWPQFRVVDTATVTPDPEVAAVVARLSAGARPRDERAARRPPRSRSTAATPPCAAARRRSAI